MTITATIPLSEGSKCYGSFTFSDGATVRVSGGLICSQHGRFHCRHHRAAHQAITATAVAQEATAVVMQGPDGQLLQVDASAIAEPNRKYAYHNDPVACWRMKTILGATTERTAVGLVFRQFAFLDGTVVTNHDRLICSQHGCHYCCHQEIAAEVIAVAARQAVGERVWSNKADISFLCALALEHLSAAAVEAADAFNADYDDYLDSLPGIPLLAAYGGAQ